MAKSNKEEAVDAAVHEYGKFKLDAKQGWKLLKNIFIFGIVIVIVFSIRSCKENMEARKEKVYASAESVWIYRHVDMPVNQEGITARDKVSMRCSVSETPLKIEGVCRNKWATEDFSIQKSEAFGTWKRRNSSIGGKFSMAKYSDSLYMGESYSDTGVPAPFQMTLEACDACS